MTRSPSSSDRPSSEEGPSSQEGLRALRQRDVPQGVLDGFYDALRERMPSAPAGGGMSLAYLGAPRALRLWRTAAVAATLLLGVGFAWTTYGRTAAGPSDGLVPLGDPRDVLLKPYESRGAGMGDIRSVGASSIPSSRRARSFVVAPLPPRPSPAGTPVKWD